MAEIWEFLTTFASPYHLFWFILSVSILLVNIVGDLLGKRPIYIWMIFMHLVVAMDALLFVLIGEAGEVFSVHCIWFNSLMAFIYWLYAKSWARRVIEQAEAEAAAEAAEAEEEEAEETEE